MSFLTWIFGSNDNGALNDPEAAAAADAKLREMAAADYGPGGKYYNAKKWAAVQGDLQTDAHLDANAAEAAVDEAFDEGWQDGAKNVSGAIKGTINKVVGAPLLAALSGIPFWVWILAALWLAWSLGWWRKILAR